MKIQLGRDDFQKLCQDYLNDSFSGTVVRGIEFINTDNQKVKISRVELDYFKQGKDK